MVRIFPNEVFCLRLVSAILDPRLGSCRNPALYPVLAKFPWVWDFSGDLSYDGIGLGNPIITTGEKNEALKVDGDELNQTLSFLRIESPQRIKKA
jgi:hypothetical protein